MNLEQHELWLWLGLRYSRSYYSTGRADAWS